MHGHQNNRRSASTPSLVFPCPLEAGMKLRCFSKIVQQYLMAHILEVRDDGGITSYYVHFEDCLP